MVGALALITVFVTGFLLGALCFCKRAKKCVASINQRSAGGKLR